jgi:hypothetical protein
MALVAAALVGCSHELSGPTPSVQSLEPSLVCTEQLTTPVIVHGDGLSPMAENALTKSPLLALPQIGLVRTKDLAGAATTDAAVPIPDDPLHTDSSHLHWTSQQSMTMTIDPGLKLAPGGYDVDVTNPNGQSVLAKNALGAIPPPELDKVAPDLFCTADGSTMLTLTGKYFLHVGTTMPTVKIGTKTYTVDSTTMCGPAPGPLAGAELCTEAHVTIPKDDLAPKEYSVVLTNPAPAGCSSTQMVTVAVVPPPEIDKAAPNPVCNAQGLSTIVFTGSGFLTVGDTRPTVAIDGTPATVSAASGCTPVAGTTLTAQECTSITVTVPKGTLTTGDHVVTVQNPAPAACVTEKAFTLTVEPPPTVTSVVPQVICTGGAELVVTGTDFSADPLVKVGGVTAVTSSSNATTIHATLGSGLAPGTYDLVVDDQDGCTATLPQAVTVTPGPSVYFIDPPTIWSGISVLATIYVSGLTVAPTEVDIRPAGGGTPTKLDSSFSPDRPNRILATVPSGLAAGDYDVIVVTGSCSATLPSGLHVTDTTTVAIADIVPPFAWTSAATAVTIDGPQMPPMGDVAFQQTPRVYLTLHGGGKGTVATPLTAVVYESSMRLTAIVPKLPPGSYDLIVVNPDRSVGVLENMFLVTPVDAPPPVISTLTPGSVIDMPGQAVEIDGESFVSPTVTAKCKDDSGTTTDLTATVGTSSSTTIAATFDMSALTSAVCVVRVTNSDTTYDEFSALGVTNPAQNLPATVSDRSMATARRGLVAAAGRVTRQARYLYAIGGDDGTDGGLLSSIEVAPVSLFGVLDDFFALPTGLPAGRSLAGGVIVGRFVYLVGGREGSAATDSVLRAELLDPAAAPTVNDLDLEPGNGTGLDPGLFYYRVSAVVSTPSNPGGETLASDPLGVIVPPVPGKVQATITWLAVGGATQYRIYRTPTPDQLVDTVQLVGTVDGGTTKFTDKGAAVMAGTPLPEGALGAWHEVGPLPTARAGAGVAFAATATGGFLYAIGGAAGATVDTYSYAAVTIAQDGSQTVGTFSNDAPLLASARWQIGAVALDHTRAAFIPDGQTWVYAAGGFADVARTSVASDVTAAQVGADGTLGPVYEVNAMSPGIAGYGFAGANDFLFAFGGASSGGGAAGAGTKSSRLCDPDPQSKDHCHNSSVPQPPQIVNWNSIGFQLQQARYLPGSTLESAFIFLVGGASDGAAATTTTERTHW